MWRYFHSICLLYGRERSEQTHNSEWKAAAPLYRRSQDLRTLTDSMVVEANRRTALRVVNLIELYTYYNNGDLRELGIIVEGVCFR